MCVELPLKFRTGGVSVDAFPTPVELASAIASALDRELPFKCTAGLHHALRQTDPETGLTHHGFLNVIAATRACLDGGNAGEILELTDADATGFGSCSILEPHDDLVELGLIPSGTPS